MTSDGQGSTGAAGEPGGSHGQDPRCGGANPAAQQRPADVVDRFQRVFFQAKKAMTDAADAAYGRHGVRSGQQFILMTLWEEDGLTPGEIARRLALATPTVTKATTRMEAAGLVHRRPHPKDRRLVCIHLSDRGEELREVMSREMRTLSERALAALSAPEREAFVHSLTEMQRNLTGEGGDEVAEGDTGS